MINYVFLTEFLTNFIYCVFELRSNQTTTLFSSHRSRVSKKQPSVENVEI